MTTLLFRYASMVFILGVTTLITFASYSSTAVMYGVSVGGNRDYPGSDYAQFKVYELERCVKACADDPYCKAFSYDPRIHSCRLKDSVPQPVRARRIKSGRKLVHNGPPAPTLPPVKPDPEVYPPNVSQPDVVMEILYSTYFYGGDYRNFTTSNFRRCAKKCKKDTRCRVFSYDERSKSCMLKSHRRETVGKQGTVSGIKRYQP